MKRNFFNCLKVLGIVVLLDNICIIFNPVNNKGFVLGIVLVSLMFTDDRP